ncbi:unnamed protein product [marine sediment metagenome]|uniref:Uncharacterized protein n=1 Tax=marine sediment metagenome TaxID=412755 RepID=X1RD04_9ZZZZ
MRLTLPLTGTVLVEGSVWGAGDLIGDNSDPIRPIPIDLGNVSWRMVDIDLENEVMVIEVEPSKEISEDTGQLDGGDNPLYKSRKSTEQEKLGFLQHAQDLIMSHTRDELYQMSKCHRLKRPFKDRKVGYEVEA